jgi:Co/Zn/Cd efflux system component
MKTYVNRWTVALSWAVLMLIVWALFVPKGVSATTFVMLSLTGLVVAVVGPMLLANHEPPRSMSAILGDLEAESTAVKRARS